MGDMDPEDAKSLDSSDASVLPAEGNYVLPSDMVHVDREEAEMLKVEAEDGARETEEEQEMMFTSVLSVLGTEKDLEAIKQEENLEAQKKKERGEFMQVVPPMALPPLPIVRLDPPSATSTPDPATVSEVVYPTSGLLPPSVLSVKPEIQTVEPPEKFSQVPLSDVDAPQVESHEEPERSDPQKEIPALLCGGAVLVAVVGVVAYGAVAYCRK